MIRIIAILAGGFLGFAAAILVAQSPRTVASPVVLSSGPDDQIFANRPRSAEFPAFETELDQQGEYDNLPERLSLSWPFLAPLPDVSDQIDRAERPADGGFTPQEFTGESREEILSPPTIAGTNKREDKGDTKSDIYRLQVQLTEIGCFDGSIDGRWSPAFHERLAEVVLTEELDLEQLGTVNNIIEALKSASPSACAIQDEIASAGIRGPDQEVVVRPVTPSSRNLPADQEPETKPLAPEELQTAVFDTPVPASIQEEARVLPTAGIGEPLSKGAQRTADDQSYKVAVLESGIDATQNPATVSVETIALPLPVRNPLRIVPASIASLSPDHARPRKPGTRRSVTNRRRAAAARNSVARKPKPKVIPWKENRAAIFPDR